jgi:hypothetical protein
MEEHTGLVYKMYKVSFFTVAKKNEDVRDWQKGNGLLSARYKFETTDVNAVLIGSISLDSFISKLLAECCVVCFFFCVLNDIFLLHALRVLKWDDFSE